ncbi:MAG: protein kinase [Chloroflexota bacterium]
MSRAANLRSRLDGRALGGRYELTTVIGSGGFADVYRARDQHTDSVVAIKVLHDHMTDDEEALRRFTSEALVASRLREPHIVRILDTGEDDGIHYIVMEYVQGLTLQKLVAQKRMFTPAEVVHFGCQALLGLGAAHAIGVIHRDVKPANLIVTADSTLKVMDFGIAKSLVDATMTGTGVLLGTPQYMAPEQISSSKIDSRSDLYALGATLYEVLVGAPPFHGQTPWATMAQHMMMAPRPPVEIREDTPPGLTAALLKALEKKPEDRFQTAAEMIEALQASIPDAAPLVVTPPVDITSPAPLDDRTVPETMLPLPGQPDGTASLGDRTVPASVLDAPASMEPSVHADDQTVVRTPLPMSPGQTPAPSVTPAPITPNWTPPPLGGPRTPAPAIPSSSTTLRRNASVPALVTPASPPALRQQGRARSVAFAALAAGLVVLAVVGYLLMPRLLAPATQQADEPRSASVTAVAGDPRRPTAGDGTPVTVAESAAVEATRRAQTATPATASGAAQAGSTAPQTGTTPAAAVTPSTAPTPSAADRLAAAARLLDEGQLDRSIELLEALYRQDPATPNLADTLVRAYVARGRDALARGDVALGETAYDQALKIRADDPTALAGKKRVASLRAWQRMEAAWGKDDDEAIQALESIHKNDPEYRSADVQEKLYALLIGRADRRQQAGDLPGAVEALEAARAVDPSRSEAGAHLTALTPTATPEPTAPPAPRPQPPAPAVAPAAKPQQPAPVVVPAQPPPAQQAPAPRATRPPPSSGDPLR